MRKRRGYTPYWDRYWKAHGKPEECPVCHDAGIVSAVSDNYDHSMNVKPCPMKCDKTQVNDC